MISRIGKITFLIFTSISTTVLVSLMIFWLLELHVADPSSFRFFVDWSDLNRPVDGFAHSFAFILIMIYWFAGFYMFLESKAATIEVQKQIHSGLALMFICLGFAHFVVLINSILINEQFTQIFHFFYGENAGIFPPLVDVRGDFVLSILLVDCSLISVMYYIEKYIKSSRKYILSRFIILGAISCWISFTLSFYEAHLPSLSIQDWWISLCYGLGLFSAVTFTMGFLAVPLIYFKLARKTTGDLKRNSVMIGTGYLLTLVFTIFQVMRDELLKIPFNWLVFIGGNIFAALLLIYSYVMMTVPVLDYYTSTDTCVICRGKIMEKMHLCPKCLVKYCDACFTSVVSVENECWNCKERIFLGKKEDIEISFHQGEIEGDATKNKCIRKLSDDGEGY
ncbi:MAG: hypothetical protein ACFFCS_01825 [Candidatus Hodarchaeota archaeon]